MAYTGDTGSPIDFAIEFWLLIIQATDQIKKNRATLFIVNKRVRKCWILSFLPLGFEKVGNSENFRY